MANVVTDGCAAHGITETMKRSADFDQTRTYRWSLWREWDESLPLLNVIVLNPSTADETVDDPTIRRCIGFAKDWGYGRLVMTNLFAYRATNPAVMRRADDPVGDLNDAMLIAHGLQAKARVAAWGAHGDFLGRGAAVRKLFRTNGLSLDCFGLTKDGHPKHPLYLLRTATIGGW